MSIVSQVSLHQARLGAALISTVFRVTCLCFAALMVGCSGSGADLTANPGTPPPSGGRLQPFFFTDGDGFMEIVKKEGVSPTTPEVSFFLFKDAKYAPYKPAPKSAILLLGDKRKISLQKEGDALVTPAGQVIFGDQAMDGRLKIEFEDGITRVIPLGIR